MNKVNKEYIYSDDPITDINRDKIAHFINDKKYTLFVKENIIRYINKKLFGIKLTKK